MDCVITIKGRPKTGYGHTKHDRTGPIKNFLVDNNVLYSDVTKHLKTCDKCSINSILEEYLRRRIEIDKFNGGTSGGLIRRALILERLALKKKEPLRPGLVNEFIWRGGVYFLSNYAKRLSMLERYMACKMTNDQDMSRLSHRLSKTDQYLVKLSQQNLEKNLTSEDLHDLLEVAEVMLD